MNAPSVFSVVLALLASAAPALAQSGTLDQVSPYTGAGFNADASSLTWQLQVRAGLTGRLEGYTLQATGAQGASFRTGVRVGAGWNTSPLVFNTNVAKPTSGTDDLFVDASSANIQLVPGALFVIEIQGMDQGTWVNGSYAPPPGTPLYPELLYLGGPGCYADCGWRIGFLTYVEVGTGTPYCFGDGTGTACPCGNVGAADNGCASSVSASGAHLGGNGTASISADSFVIDGSGMPNSSALYFQGTLRTAAGAGSVFGDGLRCASGTITRLATKTNAGGASSYPGAGDALISVKGANTPGSVRQYQCWYRNAAAYCTPATFNLTNGLEVTWSP